MNCADIRIIPMTTTTTTKSTTVLTSKTKKFKKFKKLKKTKTYSTKKLTTISSSVSNFNMTTSFSLLNKSSTQIDSVFINSNKTILSNTNTSSLSLNGRLAIINSIKLVCTDNMPPQKTSRPNLNSSNKFKGTAVLCFWMVI